MEDWKILMNITDYEYDNAPLLAKVMNVSQKKAEDKLKELEKQGLVELEWGDESIGDGKSRDYIYTIELTDNGKKLLESKK